MENWIILCHTRDLFWGFDVMTPFLFQALFISDFDVSLLSLEQWTKNAPIIFRINKKCVETFFNLKFSVNINL